MEEAQIEIRDKELLVEGERKKMGKARQDEAKRWRGVMEGKIAEAMALVDQGHEACLLFG